MAAAIELTREHVLAIRHLLLAPEMGELPRRGMAAVAERFGADGTNPDEDYGVRLNRVLNM